MPPAGSMVAVSKCPSAVEWSANAATVCGWTRSDRRWRRCDTTKTKNKNNNKQRRRARATRTDALRRHAFATHCRAPSTPVRRFFLISLSAPLSRRPATPTTDRLRRRPSTITTIMLCSTTILLCCTMRNVLE